MRFPLDLRFKLLAIAQQIFVRDADGQLVLYVRQKAFKLKESVTVFADERQALTLFHIEADRMLDISARYAITDRGGGPLGYLQRRGMRSIWRAHYEIHRGGSQQFLISEENPWVKVIDGLIGDVPVIGFFSGYMFHPRYVVARPGSDDVLFRITKEPAFFEGRYTVERLGAVEETDEQLIVLSLLMMLLLERSRG